MKFNICNCVACEQYFKNNIELDSKDKAEEYDEAFKNLIRKLK